MLSQNGSAFFWFSAKSMNLFEFIKRMQGFIKGSEFYWLV